MENNLFMNWLLRRCGSPLSIISVIAENLHFKLLILILSCLNVFLRKVVYCFLFCVLNFGHNLYTYAATLELPSTRNDKIKLKRMARQLLRDE